MKGNIAMLLRASIFFSIVLLTACSDDDPYSKYYGNWDESLTLAAKCVALSERFFLFEEASKHYKKGLEFQSSINREKLSSATNPTELANMNSDSLESRIMLMRKALNHIPSDPNEAEQSKRFAANSLIEACKVKLLNSQFVSAP
jgi:hypothetical protein